MKPLILSICLMLAAAPAAASTSWITAGELAALKIRKLQPGAKIRGTRDTGMAGAEKLHLLEVKTRDLDKLSGALHRELRHCGGFMYHATEAAGRPALALGDAVPLASLARPTYAIPNQASGAPLLQQMRTRQCWRALRGSPVSPTAITPLRRELPLPTG